MRHVVKKYELCEISKKLVDLDHCYSLITGETIKGKIKEPIAINLVFGLDNMWKLSNVNSNLNILCNLFVQTKGLFI